MNDTSTQDMSVAIDKITVGTRIRSRNPAQVAALKDTIHEHGLIHPIVVAQLYFSVDKWVGDEVEGHKSRPPDRPGPTEIVG